MPDVLEQTDHAKQSAMPRVYSTATFADLLHRLGDIPPERVRMDPLPGQATINDLIQVNEQKFTEHLTI
jgi:hypothetical protein